MNTEIDVANSRMHGWKRWLIRLVFWSVVVVALVFWAREVAIVVASMLLVLLIVYFWIVYKIKKWLKPLENMNLFPTEIHLLPAKHIEAHHGEEEQHNSETLLRFGFESIGFFTVDAMPGVNVHAFVHPEKSAYAAVYDEQSLGVWVDIVSEYRDGSYFTITTNKAVPDMERPPDKIVERYEGEDLGEMFTQFLEARPDGEWRPVSREGFAESVERYFAEEQAWQMERVDQEEEFARQLRESFLEASGWSAIEWDRKQHRVIFIHDHLGKDEVEELYMDGWHVDEGDDEEYDAMYDAEADRAKRLAKSLKPREAMAAMIEKTSGKGQFEKLLAIQSPVEADVYLTPEQPDDWDES